MLLRGAYRVTGTHTSRATLRRDIAANPVFLMLRGRPSVMTMTTDFDSLRLYVSSAFALINAKEVRVLPWGNERAAIASCIFLKSRVKCSTVLILQTVSSFGGGP